MKKKHTFTLKFEQDGYDAYLSLSRKAGVANMSGLMAKSFAVLECLLDLQADGNSIVIESPDGTRKPFEIK